MVTMAFQIYFGIKAFRSGWRWRILPAIAAYLALAAVILTVTVDPIDMVVPGLVLDLGLIFALRAMSRRPFEVPGSLEVQPITTEPAA